MLANVNYDFLPGRQFLRTNFAIKTISIYQISG